MACGTSYAYLWPFEGGKVVYLKSYRDPRQAARPRREASREEFELVVPDCQDKQCKFGAALGIATFFPRTYERVK